jgi:hypothetical protein
MVVAGSLKNARVKMAPKNRKPPKNHLSPSEWLMCDASKSRHVSAATPSSLRKVQPAGPPGFSQHAAHQQHSSYAPDKLVLLKQRRSWGRSAFERGANASASASAHGPLGIKQGWCERSDDKHDGSKDCTDEACGFYRMADDRDARLTSQQTGASVRVRGPSSRPHARDRAVAVLV